MGSIRLSTVNAWSRFLRVFVFRNSTSASTPFPQGTQSGSVYTSGWGTAGKEPFSGFARDRGVIDLTAGYKCEAFSGRQVSVFDPRIVRPSAIAFSLAPFRHSSDGDAPVRWRSESGLDVPIIRPAFIGGRIFQRATPTYSPLPNEIVPVFPGWSAILPRSSIGLIMCAGLSGPDLVVPPLLFFGANALVLQPSWRLPANRFAVPVPPNGGRYQDIWYIGEDGLAYPQAIMVHPVAATQTVAYIQRDSEGDLFATTLSGETSSARDSTGANGVVGVFFTHCLSVPITEEAAARNVAGVVRTQDVDERVAELMAGGVKTTFPATMLAREPGLDLAEVVASPYLQDAMPILSALAKHADFEAPVYRRLYGDHPTSFVGSGFTLAPDIRSFRVPDGTSSESLKTGNVRFVQLRTRSAIFDNLPLSDAQVELPYAPPKNEGAVAFAGKVIRGVRVEFVPRVTTGGPVTHGFNCPDDYPAPPDPWVTEPPFGTQFWQPYPCVQGGITPGGTLDLAQAVAGQIINLRKPGYCDAVSTRYDQRFFHGMAYDCGPDPALPPGAFRYAGVGPRQTRSNTVQFQTLVHSGCYPPPPPTPFDTSVEFGCCTYQLPPCPDGSQFGGAGQPCGEQKAITTQDQCSTLGSQFGGAGGTSSSWARLKDCNGGDIPATPGPLGACLTTQGTGGQSQFGGAGSGVPGCTGDLACSYVPEYLCSGQWFGPWSGCHETGIFGEWMRSFRSDAYQFDFRTDHAEIYAQLGASIYSPAGGVLPAPEHLADDAEIAGMVPILGLALSIRQIATTQAVLSGEEMVSNLQYVQNGALRFGGTVSACGLPEAQAEPSPPQDLPRLLFSPEQTAQLLDGNVVTPTRWLDPNPANRSLPFLLFGGSIDGPSTCVPGDIDGRLFPEVGIGYEIRVQLLSEAPAMPALGPHVTLSCPPPGPPPGVPPEPPPNIPRGACCVTVVSGTGGQSQFGGAGGGGGPSTEILCYPDATQEQCATLNGSYLGDNTVCGACGNPFP
jgi:hypothetical protein